MQTSGELKAHLSHGAHELRQVLQLLATISDRVQTASDEVQLCSGRADLIDPTIDALNHQIHGLNEEMDRVYALRNDEGDSYLREENSQLKKDITALQQALRREIEQHQAHFADAAKSNEELVQRVRSLEQFNNQLKSRANEMKEQYDSAIINVVDLKDTNAGLKDTVKSLRSTPAFNVLADTASSSHENGGASPKTTSPGPIPFGKTVVETNRVLTVTIESSPHSSPEKANLNHDWIPQIPSGAAVPFPDIAPQPQFVSLTPANGGSTPAAIRAPGRPKARPIVRGTQEANESFERMKRTLASSPSANFTDLINIDNNATAASSSSASEFATPVINPFGVQSVTSNKVKSKLNPAVEAFAPSNSSGKDSAKSGSMQASSPIKNYVGPSVNATTSKEKGFVLPHLRLLSKISVTEEPVTATQELSVKDKIGDQGMVATSVQNESTKKAEPLQPASLTPRILPHLRHLTKVTKNEDVHPSQVQRSVKGKNEADPIEGTELLLNDSPFPGMKENVKAATTPGAFVRHDPEFQAWLDTQEKFQSNKASINDPALLTNDNLIELDHYDSPKAGEKKTVHLSPGFTPVSPNVAPEKTETAAPIDTDRAASPTTVHDPDSTAQDQAAAPSQSVPTKTTSEKEINNAFLTEYNAKLSSISEKYGRDSRKGLDIQENETDPVESDPEDYYYIPPRPTGTRKLGSLLDAECRRMVLKPGKVAKEEEKAQEWKAIRKDGKIVYVL